MMCLGMFMAILDVQVVATSIPTIQTALGVRPDQMSWIQTAYLIAEVVAIPLTGFLTRILTLRWLFVGAITVFTLASLACAASGSFESLIAARVVQGFAGGTLIPAVFSAVFLMFPPGRQALATTIAGVLAVLAPTVGPIVGGWITDTYSWHWLFLINALPGLLAACLGLLTLPAEAARPSELRRVDGAGLALMAMALASLVVALKEAPSRGWLSAVVLGLLMFSALSFGLFVSRSLRVPYPVVNLRTLGDVGFATGCALSFVLGIGLFGSVYMMPVFLAKVHGLNAFDLGQVMLVTGVAQLVTAPIAVYLEERSDPRLLSLFGFVLFAVGLAMSAFQTIDTGFAEMLWPQIIRGVAIMFCLLPPTRMALGHLAADKVPDASGLFNLMRNLGGAIGLALIDSVLYGRAPGYGAAIVVRLQAGDQATAQALGLPPGVLPAQPTEALDATMRAYLMPLVENLAFVQAMNAAWAVVAAVTLTAAVTLPVLAMLRQRRHI